MSATSATSRLVTGELKTGDSLPSEGRLIEPVRQEGGSLRLTAPSRIARSNARTARKCASKSFATVRGGERQGRATSLTLDKWDLTHLSREPC